MKKVMVVDDDMAIVDVIKLILEMENYEVTTSFNGSTLLQVQEELPDLLLLDLWMPGIDGKTLCKKLKSLERTKHVPIVIISAHKNIKQEANDAGADGFLEKPFEMDVLLEIVKKHTSTAN